MKRMLLATTAAAAGLVGLVYAVMERQTALAVGAFVLTLLSLSAVSLIGHLAESSSRRRTAAESRQSFRRSSGDS